LIKFGKLQNYHFSFERGLATKLKKVGDKELLIGLQTPVCNICLKSGILCQGCSTKLKEGKISNLDLKISRVLFELSKKHRGLEKLNFKGSVDASGLVILKVERGQIPLVVGKGGKLVQEIERTLKTKIRVVEEGANHRKLAQDILAPAEVIGVNVLYTTSGNEYRVRVPRQQMKRLPAEKEKIKTALSMLTNKNFTIVFE
jgi:transcription antitermination factor NusA-like protein